MHTTDVTNPRRIELAKKVSEVMPAGLRGNCHTSVFQAGSDAVETAIKFARRQTGRSQIIAFQGAYHGVWCGTAALTTGYDYRHGWGPLIAGVTHAPYAYCYRCAFGMTYPACGMQCAKYIDYILNTPYTGMDDVAAVIVESEQGEGGYVAPPPEFFQIIKAACEKNGCLYVADEVQSGAGRTGKMWCIEYANVVPDILTWGKGMGGDLPMAGITYRADMEERLSPGSQPSTFAGNALSCEVCMTNIDLITDPEMDLMGRAVNLGAEIKARLTEGMSVAKCIGEVRGRGLMIGCEVVADRETKEPLDGTKVSEITMRLLSSGVLMTPCGRNGNVFRFMPPLTIPRDYALTATDIMIDILKDY